MAKTTKKKTPSKRPAKTKKPAAKEAATRRTTKPKATAPTAPSTTKPRDPRLPATGSVLEKTYKGEKLAVQVTADGYLYKGKAYASLTAVALAITGYRAISGPRFFGTGAKGGAA